MRCDLFIFLSPMNPIFYMILVRVIPLSRTAGKRNDAGSPPSE